MNEDLFRKIKSRLKSEFYLMNDEWLRGCIEFYVTECTNLHNDEIFRQVKGQWLLSDLRIINNENGSLPCNLSQHKLITLPYNYILQVEEMYDIATSKYKQLEQIRNTHISEIDLSETEKSEKWEPPKKRMMQLKLTDGLQEVIGIEYNQIAQLNKTLVPGKKILVIGPVKCRRGVLLLEEGKLKDINGEVETLLNKNALENVLARALNLPENPDPYGSGSVKNSVEEKEKLQVPDTLFEDDFEINLEEVSKIEDLQSNNRQTNLNTNTTEIKRGNSINTNSAQKKEQRCKENIVLEDDDCFLEMVNEEQLVESQREQKSIAAPFRTLPTEENNDIIIVNDEEMLEKVSNHEKIVKKEEQFSYSKPHGNSSRLTNTTVPSTSAADSKVCKKQTGILSFLSGGKRHVPLSPETVTAKKGKIDRKITEFSKRTDPPEAPKICEFIHDIKKEVITSLTYRKIRGRVETFKKLTKKDSCWFLEAKVTDGTGNLEVSFSNEVIQNLLGFSVQEFSVKKKQKSNPEIEHELRKGFRVAESKIQTLDALLELELNTDKKPKVIEIIDLTQKQKDIIEEMLTQFLNRNN